MPGEIIAAPCDGNPVSSATAAIAENRLIFLSFEYIRVIPEREMDSCVLQALKRHIRLESVWFFSSTEAFNVGKSEIMLMFAINTEGVSEVIPPQNDLWNIRVKKK